MHLYDNTNCDSQHQAYPLEMIANTQINNDDNRQCSNYFAETKFEESSMASCSGYPEKEVFETITIPDNTHNEAESITIKLDTASQVTIPDHADDEEESVMTNRLEQTNKLIYHANEEYESTSSSGSEYEFNSSDEELIACRPIKKYCPVKDSRSLCSKKYSRKTYRCISTCRKITVFIVVIGVVTSIVAVVVLTVMPRLNSSDELVPPYHAQWSHQCHRLNMKLEPEVKCTINDTASGGLENGSIIMSAKSYSLTNVTYEMICEVMNNCIPKIKGLINDTEYECTADNKGYYTDGGSLYTKEGGFNQQKSEPFPGFSFLGSEFKEFIQGHATFNSNFSICAPK